MLAGDDNGAGEVRDGRGNRGYRGDDGMHRRDWALSVEWRSRATDCSGQYQRSNRSYSECRCPRNAKCPLPDRVDGRAYTPASPYAHSTALSMSAAPAIPLPNPIAPIAASASAIPSVARVSGPRAFEIANMFRNNGILLKLR